MKASQERMEALMGVSIGAMEAYLERKKPTPEETANATAHPKGSNGATREKTIGATEDRPRDCEETDPGQLWIPAEGGRCPQMVDSPCRSCTA